jgi:hypothetical protein
MNKNKVINRVISLENLYALVQCSVMGRNLAIQNYNSSNILNGSVAGVDHWCGGNSEVLRKQYEEERYKKIHSKERA